MKSANDQSKKYSLASPSSLEASRFSVQRRMDDRAREMGVHWMPLLKSRSRFSVKKKGKG
jgi:hypothetical protein